MVKKTKGAPRSPFQCARKTPVVRETGLEPVRWNHTPLKRARLPISPLSLVAFAVDVFYYNLRIWKSQYPAGKIFGNLMPSPPSCQRFTAI